MLLNIATKLLSENFWIVIVNFGIKTNVLVHFCSSFALIGHFIFKDMDVLDTLIVAKVTIDAILSVNKLSVLYDW